MSKNHIRIIEPHAKIKSINTNPMIQNQQYKSNSINNIYNADDAQRFLPLLLINSVATFASPCLACLINRYDFNSFSISDQYENNKLLLDLYFQSFRIRITLNFNSSTLLNI